MPGDKCGFIRGQKQRGIRYVVDSQHDPFQRSESLEKLLNLLPLLPICFLHQRRGHRERRHAVHPYTVLPKLSARGPDEPNHSVLRHGVVRPPIRPSAPHHARRAYNTPPHALLHHRTRGMFDASGHTTHVDRKKAVELGEIEVEDHLREWNQDFIISEWPRGES